MSLSVTKSIGRKGKRTKFKVPSGMRGFSFKINSGSTGFTVNPIEYRTTNPVAAQTIIRVKEQDQSFSDHPPFGIISVLNSRFASRSWSATPANYRLYQRLLYSNRFNFNFPSNERNEEPINESFNCEEQRDTSYNNWIQDKGIITFEGGGLDDFYQFQIDNRTTDSPTVQTTCEANYKMEGFLIVPEKAFVSVEAMPGYPGICTVNEL